MLASVLLFFSGRGGGVWWWFGWVLLVEGVGCDGVSGGDVCTEGFGRGLVCKHKVSGKAFAGVKGARVRVLHGAFGFMRFLWYAIFIIIMRLDMRWKRTFDLDLARNSHLSSHVQSICPDMAF